VALARNADAFLARARARAQAAYLCFMVSFSDVLPLLICGFDNNRIALTLNVSSRLIRRLRWQNKVSTRDLTGQHQATRQRPSDSLMDQLVTQEVLRVGHAYGRKMLSASLSVTNPLFHFARERVQASMQRLFPIAMAKRAVHAARRIQRGAYHAPHFGYSAHLDLACKLQVRM